MSKVPWDYSKGPAPGETSVPNMPTPEGIAMGERLARLCDVEEAKQRERFEDQHPRCDDCALLRGTRPNGCAETQMDALKCVLEGVPFYCHKGIPEDLEPKRLCAGWVTLASVGVADELRRTESRIAAARRQRMGPTAREKSLRDGLAATRRNILEMLRRGKA